MRARAGSPPKCGEARGQAGSGSAVDQDSSKPTKPTFGRPEAQGMRVERNPDQRPPMWLPPAGAAAALDLDAALANWTTILGRPPIDPTRGRR